MLNDKWFDIASTAINSVLPENLIESKVQLNDKILTIKNHNIDLGKYKKIKILGSGKASVKMAKALENKLKEFDFDGLVVCNYKDNLKNIEIMEGSHPFPDKNSILAAKNLIKKLESLNNDDFFIYLLSGGSSAMLELPEEGLDLKDLKKCTEIFLKSGMNIEEINTIRPYLSKVKSGKLCNFTKADGIILILSDVIGDKLEFIGSGPFYSEKSHLKIKHILEKYNLNEKLPKNILKLFSEEIKSQNCKFKHFILGNLQEALFRAKEYAKKLGFDTFILTDMLNGDANESGQFFASIINSIMKNNSDFKPPLCLLAGGETTVSVKGNGKGGRNSEFVLSLLCNLNPMGKFCIGSFGTDGIDGITNSAGAFFDENVYDIINNKNLNPNLFLENNDSGTFFEKTGYNFVTGKTGTNVGDIILILVEDIQ